uniref:Putative 8.9 kDa family member n=1 Tax=Rhipicephalus pulchellus TaxID=72859 RepID=L7LRE3_RHIPC
MLLKGLTIALVLWLSSCRGDIYANVDYVVVPNVNVTNQYCYYNHSNFTDRMNVSGTCEEFWCYPYNHTVVRLRCKNPPPGCNLTLVGEFPHCCNHKCFNVAHNCLGSDYKLIEDGKNRSLVKPCQLEGCSGGVVTVLERCPGAGDPNCKSSFANETEPYPACCGPATACTRQ